MIWKWDGKWWLDSGWRGVPYLLTNPDGRGWLKHRQEWFWGLTWFYNGELGRVHRKNLGNSCHQFHRSQGKPALRLSSRLVLALPAISIPKYHLNLVVFHYELSNGYQTRTQRDRWVSFIEWFTHSQSVSPYCCFKRNILKDKHSISATVPPRVTSRSNSLCGTNQWSQRCLAAILDYDASPNHHTKTIYKHQQPIFSSRWNPHGFSW